MHLTAGCDEVVMVVVLAISSVIGWTAIVK
jgi:hypothetical protein